MTIDDISGCIGREICVETCPCDVIRIDQATGKAGIIFSADCRICHLCRMYRPVDAITLTPEKTIPAIASWGRP